MYTRNSPGTGRLSQLGGLLVIRCFFLGRGDADAVPAGSKLTQLLDLATQLAGRGVTGHARHDVVGVVKIAGMHDHVGTVI